MRQNKQYKNRLKSESTRFLTVEELKKEGFNGSDIPTELWLRGERVESLFIDKTNEDSEDVMDNYEIIQLDEDNIGFGECGDED